MHIRKQRCETPWPPQDNSVGVVLVAHSMGGLIASDSIFSILDQKREQSHDHMFPLVHGILTFDTPYNGLARSMFVYGAFSNYQKVSNVWNAMTAVSAGLYSASLPIATTTAAGSSTLSSSRTTSPKWRAWQILAIRSGTYGVIAAGGVAAYANREHIMNGVRSLNRNTLKRKYAESFDAIGNGLAYINRDSVGQSFEWLSTHLQFVGALMRQKEMSRRLERLAGLRGIGIQNIYFSLGENGYWTGGYFVPERTFCAVPEKGQKAHELFSRSVNKKAKDEVVAHTTIFKPELNGSYNEMATNARDSITKWFHDESEIVDSVPIEIETGEEDRPITIEDVEQEADLEKSTPADRLLADEGEDESPLDIAATAAAIPLPDDIDSVEGTTERQKYLQGLLRIAQNAGSGVASAGVNFKAMMAKRGESSIPVGSKKGQDAERESISEKRSETGVDAAKSKWNMTSLFKKGTTAENNPPALEVSSKEDIKEKDREAPATAESSEKL
ncbi:hypothetical protein PVAG01_06872 [Phlyctema vagabunda]|uniref:DUF676 domain-containing protein n=1 Tax=Phlyctema vagabunda TaxID=108571 RepID=A0ABR4PHB0_9HELO